MQSMQPGYTANLKNTTGAPSYTYTWTVAGKSIDTGTQHFQAKDKWRVGNYRPSGDVYLDQNFDFEQIVNIAPF